jgi:hypothetical protein
VVADEPAVDRLPTELGDRDDRDYADQCGDDRGALGSPVAAHCLAEELDTTAGAGVGVGVGIQLGVCASGVRLVGVRALCICLQSNGHSSPGRHHLGERCSPVHPLKASGVNRETCASTHSTSQHSRARRQDVD